MDIVRVGIISTVNLEQGTAQVYYPDRGSTTGQLQLFAFRAEFSPPAVGDQVVVLHLSNDSSSGIVMGRFWGEADLPPGGVDYRKNFGADAYEALENGVYTVRAPDIQMCGSAGSISLAELVDLKRRVEVLERDGG
ncbi:hypothetical protein [Clostridium sp. AN503]|uniref:hypothetical protein n=1 Tax=Clostridium sp. AN503 TaxID=3160598 RepID=UPI003458F44E